MRRAAYIGASVAASAAVILRAFHDRPNFYSAAVYLGQSTACRMILLNMLLIVLGSSIYSLQRLLYGPLRAIEIEQLWDKAWYAITETALAMTTFRDEVGGYFFLMFMTLLAGKVWGWIGEGRVETLEQQPLANPKTFHARLITSLLLSEIFDLLMLRYCARTILDQSPPRAGMMVMFVFEFAILAINSSSTLARYGLALHERYVIHTQTKAKIEERKEEIRVQREADRRREIESRADGPTVPPPEPIRDEEIDENEIDVPGWQEKGRYILFLDLLTDFLKLLFYAGFFLILIIFAGIPIHMFRDLYMTTRSFIKRISDYIKYRNATRDMNTRYPDATAEELERDGTCIICREEMRPWQDQTTQVGGAPARPTSDERRRPKKLPCGHILHVGCLRSWLERQQVCPTCRRSVLAPGPSPQSTAAAGGMQAQAAANGNQPARGNDDHAPDDNHGQADRPNNNGRDNDAGGIRARTFNFGGFRLTFATGNARQVRNALETIRNGNNNNHNQQNNGEGTGASSASRLEQTRTQLASAVSDHSLHDQLMSLEQSIMGEINRLGASREQLAVVRALEGELVRLRAMQAGGTGASTTQAGPAHSATSAFAGASRLSGLPPAQATGALGNPGSPHQQQVFGAQSQQAVLRPDSAELPPGMTLPEGWSMLPLQRLTSDTQASGLGLDSQVTPQQAFPSAGRSTSMPPPFHSHAPGLAASVRGSRAATPQPSSGGLQAGSDPLQGVAQAMRTAQGGSEPLQGVAQAVRTARQSTVPDATPTSTAASTNGMAHSSAASSSQRVNESGGEDDPQLITGLPDWSNAAFSANPPSNAAGASRPTGGQQTHANEGEESHADASPREDKGKGRAVTVEEAPEHEA